MIDDERDLKQRFEELRSEEARGIPRFRLPDARRQWRRRPMALAAASSLLLAVVALFLISSPSPDTAFSDADRAAVESMAGWHPPTDFLLHTPGSEILDSTPPIPEPMKGASP